jgi:signal peptidase I
VARGGHRRTSSRRHHVRWDSRRLAWVVLAAVAAAYWFTQWPLPRLLSGAPGINFYLVQPLIWGGIALLAGYGWRRLEDRPRFSRLLMGIAALVGVFHVAVLVIAGVIAGFGASPLAGRLVNYPKNLWYLATLVAGAEMARAYLYRVWVARHRRLAFGATTLLFFAVALPAGQWTPFGDLDQTLRVVGGRWAPGLALSALATFLTSFGGPAPAFAYRLIVVSFEWFSPILPDLAWPGLFLVGVLTPLASAWLIQGIYRGTPEGAERLPLPPADQPAPPVPKWRRVMNTVATVAVLGLALAFVSGAFGYRTVVVDGISMEPAYSRGDLAIVREGVDPGLLEVGDVVLYHQGRLPVVHRIVSIEVQADGLVVTTRGDNVTRPDPAIAGDLVEGKVVFLVPWVGHLALWLR